MKSMHLIGNFSRVSKGHRVPKGQSGQPIHKEPAGTAGAIGSGFVMGNSGSFGSFSQFVKNYNGLAVIGGIAVRTESTGTVGLWCRSEFDAVHAGPAQLKLLQVGKIIP